MNVLFLTQIVPYPPHGGVLQRGYNLLREMSRFGDVHLLAFLHPDTLPNEKLVEESRTVLGKYCRTVEYFPLWPKLSKVHRLLGYLAGAVVSQPFSVLAHRSKAVRKAVQRCLETEKIDIFHVDTIALAQYDSRTLSLPKVMTHHNIESKLMARRASVETGIAARYYLELQARRLAKYEARQSLKFDMNIMMSELDAADLRRMAPGVMTAIVPNGVDIEYFQPRHGEEGPALIYTGGMNMFANRDAVLYFVRDIWPAVKQAVPEVVFYAVGQDPPAELRALSEHDPQIKVTGYVQDVRPYVSRSAVYIVPLRVGGGTRLKVVDAMAQGKAIVSTSIGCEGIDVLSGKNIVIADEPRPFARNVIELLCDATRRKQLGDAARELAEAKYAWPRIGKQLQEAYLTAMRVSQTRVQANHA